MSGRSGMVSPVTNYVAPETSADGDRIAAVRIRDRTS